MLGLPGRGISQTQGLYLYSTAQNRKTIINIHALSGIRTHEPRIHAAGPYDHWDP
jgi:hypothetical protein